MTAVPFAVLPAVQAGPEALTWEVPHLQVRAERVGGRWTLHYNEERLLLPSAPDAPVVGLVLGKGEVVAHLHTPVLVPPMREFRLNLAWPLEVVILHGGVEVVRVRPGARQTLVGPVATGQLLRALRCGELGNDDVGALSMGYAALRMTVRSRADKPVTLRRVPISEGGLGLAVREGDLVAGDVVVTLHDAEGSAEARTLPFAIPPGYQRVGEPPSRRVASGFTFDWLIDSTRRSTEFKL